MKNVNISWDLPTTRESGLPLDVADIRHVAVEISADLGVNFTPMDEIAPPETSVTINDLEVGDWIFRLIVVDTNGRSSANVDVPVNVPDETAPNAVTNIQVTFV